MLRVSSGFEAALQGSRSVDWRASFFDKRGNPLPQVLDIHSWSLNEDVEQVPMGIFTLTVVDPAYRLDVSPASAHKWLSRVLSFEWGVYVTDRYEYSPLFEGPITAARREGAQVTFTACTKDGQGVDPYFFKKSFSVRKHARISNVLKAIAEERGETKIDIPPVPRRLNRDRAWAAGQEPWRVMQQLTNVLDDHQLYYRPDGTLRLRRFPESPAWKFTETRTISGSDIRIGSGVNNTIILGHPESRFDIEPLFNTWMVRGERNHKKPIDVKMELDQKAESGDSSIHVDHAPNAPNDLEPGSKIVIGKGNAQETRTIAGSYTPGSETIPLTRNLSSNHKIGAPVSVTVMKDRVKPVVGRAALINHPYSPESLTDGKRPRIKIEDKPGIHRKDAADARAEKKIRRMRAGIETEIGVKTLIVPHLEIGDLIVAETDAGSFTFRLKNRELNSDGTMVLNRRRKLVPKKPKKGNGKGPKATVKRVRKETLGGVVDEALTTSWSDGERLKVEAVTDFSAEGGSVVFEPGTDRQEVAHYTTIDEVTDELVGVTRPNTKKAHAAGTFVQAGEEPTIEKSIDAYVDDEMISAVGIPVPPSLYGYLSVDTIAADEKVVPLQVDEEGELSVLEGPAGEPPQFDQDGEVLPPASTLPPPSGGTVRPPTAPTNLVVDDRVEMFVEPTVFLDMSWDHDGLYEDGGTVAGLSFRIEIYEGAALVLSTDTTQTTYTRLVELEKDYEVKVYARDLAGNLSEPATTTISTGTDTTPPAVPSGVTITGGANGGGNGILFLNWTPLTESDFSHVEIHASTTNGFTPSSATRFLEIGGTSAAVIKAHNGTSMTTFGYTTTVYIKLVAVDTSGNASAASTQVSGTASQVQSADITDIQSDNYSAGSAGWRITKSGNAEFQNGTFRGTVVSGSLLSGTIVSMSASGGSVTINGALNQISLGSGLVLSGSSTGSIAFGSGCVIYGSGSGSIAIGTGMTLDGTGSGTITGGLIRTAGSGNARVQMSSGHAETIRWISSGEAVMASIVVGMTDGDMLISANDDIQIQPGASSGGLGFFGVTPASRPSMTNLAGSDSTTAQLHSKVNNLLDNLRNFGLLS